MKLLLVPIFLLAAFSSQSRAEETVKPVTGTYEQALQKAEEAGKVLMLDFYADW